MISKELRNWKYYWDKFPLYFKNSNGIIEHFQILFDLLVQNDDLYDELFEFLNVFDVNSKKNMDILLKIGALYGFPSKNITFNFQINVGQGYITTNNNVKTNITLSDEEYLILILCQIVKNNYESTFEDMNHLYNIINKNYDIRLNVVKSSAGSTYPYSIIINEYPTEEHINYYYLLVGDLITLNSLGVYLQPLVENHSYYMYYNDNNEVDASTWDKWDGGYWY